MIGSTASHGGIGRRLLNVSETAQYLALEVDTVYEKARLFRFESAGEIR